MKKTKIFAASLAAMICVGSLSLSGLSANATASFSYDLEFPAYLSSYTFAAYAGTWMGSGYRPSVVYQCIGTNYTNLLHAQLLRVNCTTLTLDEDGLDTFYEIYADYEDALALDYCGTTNPGISVENDDTETIKIYMYDNAPITETSSSEPVDFTVKKDMLTMLCKDLQAEDILLAAEYYNSNWVYSLGGFYQSFKFTNIPEGETEAMQEIVSAYDDDAVVTAAEIDGVYTYTIATIEDYIAYCDAGDALRAAYPDATGDPFDNYCIFSEDTSALLTESIDLLAALSDGDDEETSAAIGDINLDGVVNMADVIRLNKYVGGTITLSAQELACADCYADGNVDADDALILLKYQVNLITSLPYTE